MIVVANAILIGLVMYKISLVMYERSRRPRLLAISDRLSV
jgi:hypothetical protein